MQYWWSSKIDVFEIFWFLTYSKFIYVQIFCYSFSFEKPSIVETLAKIPLKFRKFSYISHILLLDKLCQCTKVSVYSQKKTFLSDFQYFIRYKQLFWTKIRLRNFLLSVFKNLIFMLKWKLCFTSISYMLLYTYVNIIWYFHCENTFTFE